jgi:hypothetical protein
MMWVFAEGVVTCGTIIWGIETVGVLISIAYATAGKIAAARAEGMIKFAIDTFTGMYLPTMASSETIADDEALIIRRALNRAAALT